MYIKFQFERINYLDSRIPNVNIIAVSNPRNNIIRKSIKTVTKANINDFL